MCRCTWPWNRYFLHALGVRVRIWICMRHVCKCICEIRVRKERAKGGIHRNTGAKGHCEKFKKLISIPKTVSTDTQPLAKSSTKQKARQYCDSNSHGVVHMKEESFFSTWQSPQTQPGLSTNKWQDLNMNWKLQYAMHIFSFATDKWMISERKETSQRLYHCVSCIRPQAPTQIKTRAPTN